MSYSEKVVDHFENPQNMGSLDKNDLVGVQCVKAQMSKDSAIIKFDLGLGSFTAELDQYEEIGDRLKDEFNCLE